jgi:hypothetical protein
VLTNTGLSVPQLRALDTRFDEYQNNPSPGCDPATAPPDTNIKEYLFDDANTAGWMNPTPVTYISSIHGDLCQAHPNKGDCQAARVDDYVAGADILTDSGGVVWAFARPNVSNTPGRVQTASYPATGTPYSQTSGSFFQAPTHTGHTGDTAVAGRRILTMIIVQCPAEGGNCKSVPVKTRARFGMQRMVGSGSDQDIYLEFIETVNMTGITAEYKLYR